MASFSFDSEGTLSTDEHTTLDSLQADLVSQQMEDFLAAQTRLLTLQTQMAEQEELRRQEMHTAQLKEVEECEKMLIIQEKQAEDDRLQREERARAKQKMNRLIEYRNGTMVMTQKYFLLRLTL